MKTIYYYRYQAYGNWHERIHQVNATDASIIMQLTLKSIINASIRASIEELTNGYIKFVETIAP
jgi:hypothetical protein